MEHSPQNWPNVEFHTRYDAHYPVKIDAIKTREQIADKYLPQGMGIEIGPMYWPTPLSGRKVIYIDKFHPAISEQNYDGKFPPKDQSIGAAPLDWVTDPSRLPKPPLGLDFVVINHVFEHVPNPKALISSLWNVLNPGARVMMALPDKRYTEDRPRVLTKAYELQFGPVVADSKRLEYITLVEQVKSPSKISDRFYEVTTRNEDPHLWVFESTTASLVLSEFLSMNFDTPFELIAHEWNEHFDEMIFILERT